MPLTVEDMGHLIVLNYTGRRLDAASAAEFRDVARDCVREDCQIYIIDLSKLVFVDSSGVGAIVGFLKYLGRERRLELCSLSPTVQKVFRLTRLDKVFTIRKSRKDCILTYAKLRKVAS